MLLGQICNAKTPLSKTHRMYADGLESADQETSQHEAIAYHVADEHGNLRKLSVT